MPNLVCICSGGDWADASVDHVVFEDDDFLMESLHAWYRDWLKKRADQKYLTFCEWLIENHHARPPTDDEVSYFHED